MVVRGPLYVSEARGGSEKPADRELNWKSSYADIAIPLELFCQTRIAVRVQAVIMISLRSRIFRVGGNSKI